MLALGRLFNIAASVGGASGSGATALSMRDCSAIAFLLNGADTYTFTVSPTYAGSFVSTGITGLAMPRYTNTAADGSGAWVKAANTSSNAITLASGLALVTLYGTLLPDPNVYVKCQVTSTTGLVTAIAHDLTYQRGPANLPKLSA
jgi:hypothetical protein